MKKYIIILYILYYLLAIVLLSFHLICTNIFSSARRLEKEIKEVLEEYGCDRDKKEHLLTGRRVMLAEELSKSFRMFNIETLGY